MCRFPFDSSASNDVPCIVLKSIESEKAHAVLQTFTLVSHFFFNLIFDPMFVLYFRFDNQIGDVLMKFFIYQAVPGIPA